MQELGGWFANISDHPLDSILNSLGAYTGKGSATIVFFEPLACDRSYLTSIL